MHKHSRNELHSIALSAVAAFALAVLAFSGSASAVTVDNKIGEALLADSGAATEAQALADI